MKRNELTEAKNLLVGDRFYKANDKAKAVWEIVKHEEKKTAYQTYTVFAVRPGNKFPEALKANTSVVFLRHVEMAH